MSMKKSKFAPDQKLIAGAFEVDGVQFIVAAELRVYVAAVAMNMGVRPGRIDTSEFKRIKVVEA